METSVIELVEQIERATKREAPIVWNVDKTGGVQRLVADIVRARQYLGYSPKVSLAEGLSSILSVDTRFAMPSIQSLSDK